MLAVTVSVDCTSDKNTNGMVLLVGSNIFHIFEVQNALKPQEFNLKMSCEKHTRCFIHPFDRNEKYIIKNNFNSSKNHQQMARACTTQ